MKVVIPAAGLGTRFLPATKAQPKEMLPVVDKPAIQYVVEEAVEAGMTDIIIITGRGKRAIEDHFDKSYELEHKLRESGNREALEEVQRIASMADIFYIRQKEQLGLGHAILCAKKHVGKEPFAVMLGDDIVVNDHPCIGQLVEVHEQYKASVVGVERVPKALVSRYGVISGKKVKDGVYKVDDLVEKPSPEEAPSDMAIIGRYVFEPDIFSFLEKIGPGKGGEYQLTDAMRLMCRKKGLYGFRFSGRRFDIGSKADWIRATVELSRERHDLGDDLRDLRGRKAR
ncbi:MAG: UTP--glucose-1-phosphate uridylyltransferase GalU [Thermoplasmata archaeon]|jgi:UTP--glucose-1-phosphate uridylyltransferase|nr:UTP--glucose-1-phosphate uridylyltransferase GalU [Thermoplasmata archaeon]